MIRGIFIILLLVPSAYAAEPMRSRYSAECILKAIAAYMRSEVKVAIPKIIYQSETTVEEFQKLGRANFMGGSPPDTVLTMYAYEPNIIFLRDGPENYRDGKYIEDSLAHELAHFIQVRIRGESADNDPMDLLEGEAVGVQFWFRENYLQKNIPPCP